MNLKMVANCDMSIHFSVVPRKESRVVIILAPPKAPPFSN